MTRAEVVDVVVVGGGHNGLTAAAYLARAGLDVTVLERLDHVGGAAVSTQAFPGRSVRLSRYSYLVSLLPDQVVKDLGLDLELRSRSTASYTPYTRNGTDGGLLVERPEGARTRESFRALTGGDEEYESWRHFYGQLGAFAEVVAPTLTEPLPGERAIRDRIDPRLWADVVEQPIGTTIERRFTDDVVRGVVATDALIGTFADLHDPSLVQNRCFLYHLIGNGNGEWRVPVGGMGAVTEALARAARDAGARIVTGAGVSAIRPGPGTDDGAEVDFHDGTTTHTVRTRFVLANVAPWVLRILLGEPEEPATKPVGAQLKINLLLDRLPRLRSGEDPAVAFAGTLHLDEEYDALQTAFREAAEGRLPERLPGEVYCHSLTDDSILGGEHAHTLTYFGLHTPAPLFEDPAVKVEAVRRALASLDRHLLDPIASVVATDGDGNPCIEAKVPQDIEADVAMPGGHIFHGDLEWPWAPPRALLETPAQRWGVQTDSPTVLLCGSGARRGGAVSGIGGHNAAHAVLELR